MLKDEILYSVKIGKTNRHVHYVFIHNLPCVVHNLSAVVLLVAALNM